MIARILARRHCRRTGHRTSVVPHYASGGWDLACCGCGESWAVIR